MGQRGLITIISGNALLLLMVATMLTAAAAPPSTLQTRAIEEYGAAAGELVSQWEALVAAADDLDINARLNASNTFFNRHIRWINDEAAYGVEDYWATPLETMGNARGDCEDFTIAKYITLLTMGVDPESLRLVYVKAKRSGLTQAHMVLAWYESPQSTPLILDNMETRILPADERGDLFPIFSFNGGALWIGNRNKRTEADPRARLSRWRQVLDRMQQEGFEPRF